MPHLQIDFSESGQKCGFISDKNARQTNFPLLLFKPWYIYEVFQISQN